MVSWSWVAAFPNPGGFDDPGRVSWLWLLWLAARGSVSLACVFGVVSSVVVRTEDGEHGAWPDASSVIRGSDRHVSTGVMARYAVTYVRCRKCISRTSRKIQVSFGGDATGSLRERRATSTMPVTVAVLVGPLLLVAKSYGSSLASESCD